MTNTFMTGLKNATNYTYTTNGALAHKSTGDEVYDLFALGGAYRNRSDEDCIVLFKNAFEADEKYALKCLFYLRDARGGQGERRFFRTCMKWLANANPEAADRNLKHIPLYGRWDDLYVFVNTPLEKAAFDFMKEQLALDIESKTPSLLAKWLKSENTSSATSVALATKTRKAFNMTSRQYRKVLSELRRRINVLERLMSAGQWDKIEFDKIPSKAGIIYKNAFARHDVERMKMATQAITSYEDFAKDTTTKVNAATLYPYEVVDKVITNYRYNYRNYEYAFDGNDTDRAMINKYWDNLTDYFKGSTLNAMCIVDTSGSMHSAYGSSTRPINVAISLGLYCAEKAKGPFAGHYVSFASRPQLIKTEGVDFVDKVCRIYKTNLVDNTNLEAAFDLLLNTAVRNGCRQDEIPATLLVISDMQIDEARGYSRAHSNPTKTMMEQMRNKWRAYGYTLPSLVYWNVNASKDTILDDGPNVSYVSGCSPVIFEQILKSKSAKDLMMDKLNSERYAVIQ